MQSSSKRVLGVVAALTLALIAFFLLRQPAVPDQDQIAAQLEGARASAEAHSVGGILAIVSADFKGPAPISNVDSLNFALRRGLNGNGRVQVTLSPPNVIVQGDTATSTSRVTVRSSETGRAEFDSPLTLTWRREDGRRLLVLPTKVWRVIGAQYQGGLPGEE